MGEYKKAFIYFDTNALECRHSGKSLYLAQLTINPLYYSIERLVDELSLNDKVDICIPEVVWSEIQQHMINCFKSDKAAMLSKMKMYKKSFGDLVELSVVFKEIESEESYVLYLQGITNSFLNNPRIKAKIIPSPKDEDTVSELIDKAIRAEKPFNKAKGNNKEYTDAGFKDALILSTILAHTADNLGILISSDNDFRELFLESRYANLRLCSNEKELENILCEEFNVVSIDRIDMILSEDNYLLERIIEETGFESDTKYEYKKICSYEESEFGEKIQFLMLINSEPMLFKITYSIQANELIYAECEPYSEEKNEE